MRGLFHQITSICCGILCLVSNWKHFANSIHFIFSQLIHHCLKQAVENIPIVPVQPEWFDHICRLIPNHLKESPSQLAVLNSLLDEIRVEYEESIHTLTGKWSQTHVCVLRAKSVIFICRMRWKEVRTSINILDCLESVTARFQSYFM